MANLQSAQQPIVHVFYLNHINTQPTNFGATLNPGKRLKLVDFSNTDAFAGVDNGTIDFLSINAPNLDGNIYSATTAETAGVVYPKEPNTSLVANTSYGFWLYQLNPYASQPIEKYIVYRTGTINSITTGAATTSWYNQILASGFQVSMSGQGTQTLTITAATGYPILLMSALQNITNGSAQVVGIPSVGVSEGAGNLLGDMNYLNKVSGLGNTLAYYNGYVATNTYDIYNFICKDALGNQHLFYILVNTGDTNYSAFTVYFLETLLELGGAVPNISMVRLALAPESPSIT